MQAGAFAMLSFNAPTPTSTSPPPPRPTKSNLSSRKLPILKEKPSVSFDFAWMNMFSKSQPSGSTAPTTMVADPPPSHSPQPKRTQNVATSPSTECSLIPSKISFSTTSRDRPISPQNSSAPSATRSPVLQRIAFDFSAPSVSPSNLDSKSNLKLGRP